MIDLIRRLLDGDQSEGGQALAEYSLILAFIAMACILALTALGLAILTPLGQLAAEFGGS